MYLDVDICIYDIYIECYSVGLPSGLWIRVRLRGSESGFNLRYKKKTQIRFWPPRKNVSGPLK